MSARRDFLKSALAVAATAGLPAWAQAALPAQAVDTIYVNARVWAGAGLPRASAFGLAGARIACVGSNAEVRARAGRGARVIDLQGAFAMPAFIDNHTHFVRSCFMLRQPQLRDAASREEFVARVGQAVARLKPGQWLEGGNWDNMRWGGEFPSHDWIDAVTPDNPVAIVRLDQHSLLANRKAMALAGITRDTLPPEGGLIIRDAHGEPTGLFKDTAVNLIKRAIPAKTDAEVESALREGIAHGLSKGLSQVHVPEVDWSAYDGLRRLRAKGETDLRFLAMVPIPDWERMAAIVREEGRGDDWVRWGAVKGLVDGSLGARTALLREAYTDDPHNFGIPRTPLDKLEEYVLGADGAGLQVAVHAIGDQANDHLLDVFDRVVQRHGARDRRFRLEHAQHLLAADIPRFARQGVIASMQPYHAADDGRWAQSAIGPQRIHLSWAVRSLLDSGARVTFGSDWPVAPLDPLTGLKAAVTRETIDGANPHGWVPEQRITMEEALTAYTAANAYAGFQEDRLGTLQPGKLADIAILDTDLLQVDPERVESANVLRTLVNGRVRFGEGA